MGNCDVDFFNFHHRQVWNCQILNQSKWDQNFAVTFQILNLKLSNFQMLHSEGNLIELPTNIRLGQTL